MTNVHLGEEQTGVHGFVLAIFPMGLRVFKIRGSFKTFI